MIDLSIAGKIITTTPEHPFFVRDKGWIRADELQVGDLVSTSSCEFIEIDQSAHNRRTGWAYNFRVEEYATYFVGPEDCSFWAWVHNTYNYTRGQALSTKRDFRNWAKEVGLSADEQSHVWEMIEQARMYGSDFHPDRFYSEVEGIVDTVAHFKGENYRLITESLGYGPNQRWGVDMVFENLGSTGKQFAVVEAKGYSRYSKFVDLDDFMSPGNQAWTMDRLQRAIWEGNGLADDLRKQILAGNVDHFTSYSDEIIHWID